MSARCLGRKLSQLVEVLRIEVLVPKVLLKYREQGSEVLSHLLSLLLQQLSLCFVLVHHHSLSALELLQFFLQLQLYLVYRLFIANRFKPRVGKVFGVVFKQLKLAEFLLELI